MYIRQKTGWSSISPISGFLPGHIMRGGEGIHDKNHIRGNWLFKWSQCRMLRGLPWNVAPHSAETHGLGTELMSCHITIPFDAMDRWMVDMEGLLHAQRWQQASICDREVLLYTETFNPNGEEAPGIGFIVLGLFRRAYTNTIGFCSDWTCSRKTALSVKTFKCWPERRSRHVRYRNCKAGLERWHRFWWSRPMLSWCCKSMFGSLCHNAFRTEDTRFRRSEFPAGFGAFCSWANQGFPYGYLGTDLMVMLDRHELGSWWFHRSGWRSVRLLSQGHHGCIYPNTRHVETHVTRMVTWPADRSRMWSHMTLLQGSFEFFSFSNTSSSTFTSDGRSHTEQKCRKPIIPQ